VFVVELSGYRKDRYKDHATRLEEACNWFGIARGRAQQYIKLLNEFHEEDKRTRRHILGFNESCEITDIHEMWQSKVDQFLGLKARLSVVLGSGPILREEETAQISSNNRPRNDAFVYHLAGKLLEAGIKVVAVDGFLAKEAVAPENADITFRWGADMIDIQCKRPQSVRAIDKRVRQARKQIELKNRDGIIAVDCSAVIRRPGTLLECDSARQANDFVSRTLENIAAPAANKNRTKSILGFVLFARVPAMTKIQESHIMSHHKEPLAYFQRDSICSYVFANNNESSHPELLRSVVENLRSVMTAR
jgi:hypothetical protein